MRRASRVLLVVAAAVLSACSGLGSGTGSGTEGGGTHVSVALTEYSLKATMSEVPAGKITFDVRNAGTMTHEMVVLQTDLEALAAPSVEGKVQEDAPGIAHVGEVDQLPVGDSKSVTLDLKPGNYLLICNIVGHVHEGMWSKLVVKG